VRRLWLRSLISAVLVAVPALSAYAQEMPPVRAERPYRGLFRGGVGDTSQQLTATARIGGGYDDALSRRSTPAGETQQALQGTYSSASAGASYGLSLDRVSISAQGAMGGRLYSRRSGEWLASRSASVVLGTQVLRSTRVTVAQSYWYRPYNLLSLSTGAWVGSPVPGDLVEDDMGISPRRYSTVATTAGIVQSFRSGARTSADVDYTYLRSATSVMGTALETQRAGGTLRRTMTRNLSLNLGYHYRRTDYPSGLDRRRFTAHEGNIGVDFHRPLSLTRRTLLTIYSGSSAFTVANRTQYRAFGDARLTHEMGRTWGAALAYGRNVGFVETFDQPILYDSVTAGLGGLVTRRLELSANARASTGQIGLTGSDRGYRTYMGSMTLTTSLTRTIGIGAQYFYIRYRFGGSADLPGGVARDGERQGVHAYISVWAPIFSRARRP